MNCSFPRKYLRQFPRFLCTAMFHKHAWSIAGELTKIQICEHIQRDYDVAIWGDLRICVKSPQVTLKIIQSLETLIHYLSLTPSALPLYTIWYSAPLKEVTHSERWAHSLIPEKSALSTVTPAQKFKRDQWQDLFWLCLARMYPIAVLKTSAIFLKQIWM